jgi:glycine cleavage system H protein
MYPENFRYTKEHEWVLVEGDTGMIGITDHAQSELGDIVYVDFKLGRDTLKVGDRLKQGESLGSVESVKAVSDIYSPVSGEVTEINASLADAPETLNQDPHGAAWLVKIKLSNPDELKNLLSVADYQTYIGAEK